jgi:hypothetical protein
VELALALAFSNKVASADNYLQQGDVERLGINFGLNNSELLRTDCSGGPKSYGPRSRAGHTPCHVSSGFAAWTGSLPSER